MKKGKLSPLKDMKADKAGEAREVAKAGFKNKEVVP